MKRPIIPFAVATLLPVVLLFFGVVLGVGWLWAALAYLTVLPFVLDSLGGWPDGKERSEIDPQGADALSIVLALTHFMLMALAVYAVGGASGFNFGQRILAFFAFGLFFGQVSNSNAHELIHRGSKALHWLGAWVFISHLFGHHTSAHRLVHHRLVATRDDPNTARWGQSFYHFAPKAWRGSFIQGFFAERERSRRLNPYLVYIAGAGLMLVAARAIGGFGGVAAYVALAGYATTQLLLSDYVQHYGLRRAAAPDGRPEPVGPQHSWDSPHRFSSLLMLNAPRHSDHHAHPARPYPALVIGETGPILPFSLPVMGLVAWSPNLWRHLMDTQLAEYEADQTEGRV